MTTALTFLPASRLATSRLVGSSLALLLAASASAAQVAHGPPPPRPFPVPTSSGEQFEVREPGPIASGGLASGDLDGDGDLDLVAGASVLLNQGDGVFAPYVDYGPGTAAAIGDLDGD